MPSYNDLRNKQRELIRKATDGSVFLAPQSAPVITNLTAAEAGGGVALATLPTGYDDLGWLTEDGAGFSRDVSTSEVTSWGSTTPTRTDVTADTTTLSVTAQETKLLTLGLATGVDLAGMTPDAATGEVSIAKPLRANPRNYRALVLSVDSYDGDEIYVARFLPAAKVSGYSDQAFGGGDDPITWGVTLTGEEDSAVGYSERWIFGGPGWQALLGQMGFEAPAA